MVREIEEVEGPLRGWERAIWVTAFTQAVIKDYEFCRAHGVRRSLEDCISPASDLATGIVNAARRCRDKMREEWQGFDVYDHYQQIFGEEPDDG